LFGVPNLWGRSAARGSTIEEDGYALTKIAWISDVRRIHLLQQVRTIPQTLEQRPALLFSCATVIYFAIAGVLAFEKRLWNDELFTFYIASRPAWRDVWQALLTGAEQLAPLFYIITRAFTAVLGSSRLSLRLPEMIGFWLMSASLFCFVRRRFSSAAYGLVAMLLPTVTGAFYYADEARSYGLVLGFSGLALLCWQTVAADRTKVLSRVGLALSLAAALSCHYYAALSWGPFVLAECVRTVIKRRLDLWTWIALLAGLVPLVFFWPLIKAASGYSSHFWAKPRWTTPIAFYRDLLNPALLVVFAIPIILALYLTIRSSKDSVQASLRCSLAPYELAAVFGFILVPIFGVVVAKTVTGGFTNRYAMSAVIGVSILLTWSVYVIARRTSSVGLLIAGALMMLFAADGVRQYRWFSADRQERTVLYHLLRSHAPAGVPLVIAGPHLFFELSHDAAQSHESQKFIFLADQDLAMRYTDTDSVERELLALRNWAPLDVRDFHRFCASNPEFLLYGDSEPFSWVAQELVKEGRTLTVSARLEGQFLFRVLPKGN
jgi:hypothetical protein